MARYTGPKVRVSRRLSTNIFENEKGRKALDRRPFPPGAHGRTRRRNAGSEYLAQLQEKQKAKYIYGVLERQFRKTYEEALRHEGISDVDDSRLARSLYASDASIYRIDPQVVVRPRDTDELRAAVAVASATGAPLTMRGAGTSIACTNSPGCSTFFM